MHVKQRLLRAAGATVLALGASASLATAAGNPGGWSATASLATGRGYVASATLPNGNVLVIGGTSTDLSSSTPLKTAESYSPSTGQWSSAGTMTDGRIGPGAARLTNGTILVASGMGTAAGVGTTGELYDPSSGGWTSVTGSLAQDRGAGAQVVALPNGHALVVGGSATTSSADLYTPGSGFSSAHAMGTARNGESAIGLASGKVLVVGGNGTSGTSLATGEVYDPASDSWTAVSNTMSDPRGAEQLSMLHDGRVLITGGVIQTGGGPLIPTASSDVYDPATNTFSPVASMLTARAYAGQITLTNGQVLVAGGAQPGGVLNAAEIYDPAKNTWTATGSLTQARALFAPALLPSGQVLAAAGFGSLTGSGGLSSAEVWTPPTVPGAPQVVSAAGLDGQAFVSWAQPSDGGSPITGYIVTASTGQTVTTPDARTATVVPGVTDDRPVTFTVRAVNALGTGSPSPASNSVTPAATSSTTKTVAAPVPAAAKLTISGLSTKPTITAFEKGVKLTIATTAPVTLDVKLLAYTKKATIARASNLVLAEKTAGRSGSKRTLTLKPNRTLLKGAAKSFTVGVVILARDAYGRDVTITKSIKVSTPKPKHKKPKRKPKKKK